jgi:drug/metabolite transporter (DMT)-like permease
MTPPPSSVGRSPIVAGTSLALAAALSFGATLPVIEHTGRTLGPFSTAALLYAGACLSSLLRWPGKPRAGAPITRADARWLLAIALAGAAFAPSALALGLQRIGATTASLLLNLEAFFTVLLARAFYREAIGRRVAFALALMAVAGATLAFELGGAVRAEGVPGSSALGALAILAATLGWALDNTLTRHLSERDPLSLVAWKGALGALLTSSLGLALGEPLPSGLRALVLLGCGATGYGLSLRLYVLAQRRIGAARTGSIFALAPFVGAALAWLVGDRSAGAGTAVAALLFAAGIYLHLTEHHGHRHRHQALEHEHTHRHDDGHHDHVHDPPFTGEHSHRHQHQALEHDHEHGEDVHHRHVHS